jgi:predicted TIM-barrel fold metal-dependent hydrolase
LHSFYEIEFRRKRRLKMSNTTIIDSHIHFGTPECPEGDCFWSEEFTNTAGYFAIKLLTNNLFRRVTYERIKEHFFKIIHKSRKIDKMILLALDQVYDEERVLRKERTNLYTSNKCLFHLREEYKQKYDEDKILVGASIHPYREEADWLRELEFCIENGAVLCKWIPSSQMINPHHSHCNRFYDKLSEYDLPLLCHVGPEDSLPTWDRTYKQFDSPRFLTNALAKGVTVIAAHCALPYFYPFENDDDFIDLITLLREAVINDWKLYADLSAICTPFRSPFIEDIKRHIGAEKLIYGSDYPLPISDLSYNATPSFMNKVKIFFRSVSIKNPLDKYYYLIKKMDFDKVFREGGIDRSVFTQVGEIIRIT